MEPLTAAVVLAWLVLALIVLALSALTRRIRILHAAVQMGTRLPPRAQPGDYVAMPEQLRSLAGSSDLTLLVFVDPSCHSCSKALAAAGDLSASGQNLVTVAMWRGEVNSDERREGIYHQGYQAAVFDQFSIVVTPFAILTRDEQVQWSGRVGSGDALVEMQTAIQAQAATQERHQIGDPT